MTPPVIQILHASLSLPARSAESRAAGSDGKLTAGEFVNFFADVVADVGGQQGRGVFEACNVIPRCGRAIQEEAPVPVPHQRAPGGVFAVAELEQGDLPARLPDEKVEVIVVEPAPLRRRIVRDSDDFLEHAGRWTTACVDGSRREPTDISRIFRVVT